MKQLSIIIFISLILACNNRSTEDAAYKTQQKIIIDLKNKIDSLKIENENINDQLKKCDNWVNLLEDKD